MTDHNLEMVLKAAQEAGIEWQQNTSITGRVRTNTCGSQPVEKMERFYAIAYRQGMERAAEICDLDGQYRVATLIRAHAQNQPKPLHDGSVS